MQVGCTEFKGQGLCCHLVYVYTKLDQFGMFQGLVHIHFLGMVCLRHLVYICTFSAVLHNLISDTSKVSCFQGINRYIVAPLLNT